MPAKRLYCYVSSASLLALSRAASAMGAVQVVILTVPDGTNLKATYLSEIAV